MKNITNTLGRVIVVIAAVALLIGVVGMVAAPGVSELMGSITGTMTSKGDDMLNSIGTPHAQGTPKLATPVVTLAGNTLTIEPVANATTYRVYNGNDLLVETDETTVDLAAYLPDVGNYSIRVMAMAAGYKDSGNAQVDYIKQLVPGLYETGSNYTVLIKDWDTLISEGIITADGKVVSDKKSSLDGDLMISDEITNILNDSYNTCLNLTGVIVPDSVTSIDQYALQSCTGLTSITIPDSVTSIGKGAFYGCSGLTSIVIPNSVTSVGDSAFYGCSRLTNVTLSEGITEIGQEAFLNCQSLQNINIPDGLESIKQGTFDTCKALESVTFGADSQLKTIERTAFNGCTSLTNITIPNSVSSIGQGAFAGAGLTEINIPDSVTTINSNAFAGCTGLKRITIGSGVTSINRYTFPSCTNIETITVSSENTVYHSDGNCVINTATKTLVFGCKNSVIPADGSVTTIGDDSFYGCVNLINITIPAAVTKIGDGAFSGCRGLTSITISNGVTSIGQSAFYGCTGLTSIIIPDSVATIKRTAFYDCTSLASITFEGTKIQWNAITFGTDWNKNVLATEVVCSDGTVSLS